MALPLALLAALAGLGGALGGGLASSNTGGNFFTGTKGGYDTVSRFTPDQQSLFKNFLPGLQTGQSSALDYLNNILSGSPEAFSQFETPYKRQFEQEIVPGLAERFAGLGSHGAQNSSAFQQTLGQSGRELSENLAALRGNLQQNALGQLQGFLGMGYQPSFESVYRQPTQGFLGGLGSGISQGAGTLLGLQALRGL